MKSQQDQILIYKTETGQTQIDVRLEEETVWLTQAQMIALFESSKANISEHLKHIFSSGELDDNSTVRKFRTVQREGKREVARDRMHYNLDVVISVGYRVNSKRGILFRQWANKVLKEFLLQGYSINEKILREKTRQLEELKNVVRLQEKVISENHLNTDESAGLIKIIAQYSRALDLLDDYDHQRLEVPEEGSLEVFQITYSEARKAIDELGRQTKFEGLFGREKDDSFKGSLENIYQTFGGEDLYPTTEEKAAHLLYFVVKNHSFSDGNKRIAAFLFVWFLDRNQMLYTQTGNKVIPDNALVALSLLIAESHPSDKEMMIKVIVNLISRH
ncbi:Fic/DOC family protein [Salegentibacter agarivorans]|uniref:Fic/DOC family protein n=1 Tax=Salegentibacter agarivorans TaxID=345907 RepID=A0A1I2Q7R8_9FLAO|nr:virulence protein RhuM/Fic/DOC family protein [Salegentibacter agarivorans]SFG21856.1 Fic/DOC family protein [Salegentibacter agarivorans]